MSTAPLLQEEVLEPPFDITQLDFVKDPRAGETAGLLAGLSTAEVAERVKKYGLNEVPEHKEPLWKMFMKQFTGPMQIMIECAALLCLSIQNWPDFIIIMVLLMTNGTLGFFEEKSAQASVDALKAGLMKEMPVKRDGKFSSLAVLNLVPGDIVQMNGGDIIPADCFHLKGDICQVDEAALTGESLPVKCPRKDDKERNSGRRMWSGAVLKTGECEAVVSHTGIHTMIGEAAKAIQEAGGKEVGVFEGKIIQAAKVHIGVTIIVVIVLFCWMTFKQGVALPEVLEMSLSLVIASVPVALPMVMKVTLSIGAKEMADEGGIVTHLTALEEIASMKVLCSDKTGTLTTAKMTVYYDENAKPFSGFTAKEVLEFASIASNEVKIDDPIDSAVIQAYAQSLGLNSGDIQKDKDEAIRRRRERFSEDKNNYVGFDPMFKRTCMIATNIADGQQIFIAKGMVDVVLDTKNDEGIHNWVVENADQMTKDACAADEHLGKSGYKTLGVTVRMGNGPFQFAGILPIMDPPRHDTKDTIAKIKDAHVAVKMITGDHHNIGKELARQINLGTEIYTPESLHKLDVKQREEFILKADGFAKVKPMDKHEVVDTLQRLGMVVGMTGDGVNDAPALAKAQIGIAVCGATDAAKSAGDIVLTKDGLSPIYTGVQISRRIFKRLKSYVIYRICITVQVVFFLACLALVYDLRFRALYIILLALFHDLQIVTIAYDKQVASPFPETPTVVGLLMQSWTMGVLMFVQTMGLILYGSYFMSDEFKESYNISMNGAKGVEMDQYLETAVFLQISNSSAILIFSARTIGFFFTTTPAWQLFFSTALGQVIVNTWILFFAGRLVSKMNSHDVIMVWVYDFAWLLVLDVVKMSVNKLWDAVKPKDLENNPAMVKQAATDRQSRKTRNSIKSNSIAEQARTVAQKSGRKSVSRN